MKQFIRKSTLAAEPVISDYKECKKYIKVYYSDGSYSYIKDSSKVDDIFYIIEGKDYKELEKNKRDFYINFAKSTMKKLKEIMNSENFLMLSFRKGLSDINMTILYTDKVREYLKIFVGHSDDIIQQSLESFKDIISSNKKIFKRKYEEINGGLYFIDKNHEDYIFGTYINKRNFGKVLPKDVDINNYTKLDTFEPLSIKIANDISHPGRYFRLVDIGRIILFTPEEIIRCNKNVNITLGVTKESLISSNKNENKIGAFCIGEYQDTFVLKYSDELGKYTSSFISRLRISDLDNISEIISMIHDDNTLQIFIDGMRLFLRKDFILERVRYKDTYFGKTIFLDNFCLSNILKNNVDHLGDVIVSEIKKFLVRKHESVNEWLLLNEICNY